MQKCGKRQNTYGRQVLKEVADIFETSWDTVFRAVNFVVDYGLVHRSFEDVTEIGIDEIAVFKGHKCLTLVYQLNARARRLLWCGPERRAKTLLQFFQEFGKERSAKFQFVCSDMWAPYLKVIDKKAPQALNILDRFHIMRKFNEAIDEIRRSKANQLKTNRQVNVLKRGRWLLLKRPENLSEKQTADPQLVQGQRTAFQRRGRGVKPQSKTHYEKSVWFQDFEMSTNRFIS